jgi:uncharacterized pyridoxamine 5'-phosphate oxidase family protein
MNNQFQTKHIKLATKQHLKEIYSEDNQDMPNILCISRHRYKVP